MGKHPEGLREKERAKAGLFHFKLKQILQPGNRRGILSSQVDSLRIQSRVLASLIDFLWPQRALLAFLGRGRPVPFYEFGKCVEGEQK